MHWRPRSRLIRPWRGVSKVLDNYSASDWGGIITYGLLAAAAALDSVLVTADRAGAGTEVEEVHWNM